MAKVSYGNNLNFIANKRVLADRLLTKKEKQLYIENGIYYHYDDKKVNNKCSILIIGSFEHDNPYYGGFYLFDGTFPDQYPFQPPKVLAMTQGQNVRFHPNFYVNGKVCLSILGTWSGPPWTSCQNIGSVACSIKSLFIKEPIHQEPGWEKCNPLKSKMYSQIITYKNLEIAIYYVVKTKIHTDPLFKPFKELIEKKFIELYLSYIKLLKSLMYLDNTAFESPIYRIKGRYNISNLLCKFKILYTTLQKNYGNNNHSINQPINQPIHNSFKKKTHVLITNVTHQTPITNVMPQMLVPNMTQITNINKITTKKKQNAIMNTVIKKYIRKSPNDKASLYNVGYVKLSENDNKQWIVKEIKSGKKRWFKVVS